MNLLPIGQYAAGNQPLGSGTPPVTLTFTHSNGSIVFNKNKKIEGQ
jgi:hypothetical protein